MRCQRRHDWTVQVPVGILYNLRRVRLALPISGDIPLYEGDMEKDLKIVSHNRLAEQITGGFSYPSKMDCPAWGLPIEHCNTGSKLATKEGMVCADCYASKGRFRFRQTQDKLRRAYEGLFNPLWTPAMVQQIRWYCDERFRWFHSGEVRSVHHLRNIIRVCLETPRIMHWLPTRERAFVVACEDEIPDNLTIRASGNRIDGPPPTWCPTTSTVVTEKGGRNLSRIARRRQLRRAQLHGLLGAVGQEYRLPPALTHFQQHRPCIPRNAHQPRS